MTVVNRCIHNALFKWLIFPSFFCSSSLSKQDVMGVHLHVECHNSKQCCASQGTVKEVIDC